MRAVIKPWGRETIWAETERYAGKILRIAKGQRLSLQYHRKKSESIYVLKGTLSLEIHHGGVAAVARLGRGQSYDIFAGTIHRFGAPWSDVELIEVSAGPLDDVERLEDDYGRCGAREAA